MERETLSIECDYDSTRVHDARHVIDVLIIDQAVDGAGDPVGPPQIIAASADLCDSHDNAMGDALRKFLTRARRNEPAVAVTLAQARVARLGRPRGSRPRLHRPLRPVDTPAAGPGKDATAAVSLHA
jgi:hypothetical protein